MASRRSPPGRIILFNAKFGPHNFAETMACWACLNLQPLEGRRVSLVDAYTRSHSHEVQSRAVLQVFGPLVIANS